MTAETKVLLAELHRNPEPAYPWWLPKVQASQTPAEWMQDHRPDTVTQRNGTAPHDAPDGDAYPAEGVVSQRDSSLPAEWPDAAAFTGS